MLKYESFRAGAVILFSAVLGLLFSEPIVAFFGQANEAVVRIVVMVLAVLVGYRRRYSTGFFYFELFALMIMSFLYLA